MVIVSVVATIAALLGATGGYALSKRAVEWCPTCGRSLTGHCPDGRAHPPGPATGALQRRP
jgi:hypothetical protein